MVFEHRLAFEGEAQIVYFLMKLWSRDISLEGILYVMNASDSLGEDPK